MRVTQLLQTIKYLRLRPFDVSTEAGRSAERHRRLALTGAVAVVSKGIQVGVTLVTVPLTLHYLGLERYGLWMTITSVISMFAFSDLGMSNGAMNAIAEANGRDDRETAARVITSAVMMLSCVALILGILFAISYPFVPWASIFNVKTPLAIKEVGPAVAMFVACFLFNMPAALVTRVQNAFQEGFVSAIWGILGNVMALAGLLAVIKAKAGLPWLVLAISGAPFAVWLLCSIHMYTIRRPWLRPRRSLFDWSTARRLFQLGSLFFVLQITVTLAIFCDNMVTTQVLGADRVAEYNVAQRLFGLPYMMIAMLTAGLWPAYAEAHSRGDIPWIKRTLKRSMTSTAAIIVPSATLLLIFHKPIIHLWIGKDSDAVMPSFWLIIGFAIWNVIGTCMATLAWFLNGLHIAKFQIYTQVPMAITNLALSIILARVWGLPGVIWGTVISYFVCMVVPSAIYVPYLLRHLKQKDPEPELPAFEVVAVE